MLAYRHRHVKFAFCIIEAHLFTPISLPLWKEIIVSLNSSIICTLRPFIPITYRDNDIERNH